MERKTKKYVSEIHTHIYRKIAEKILLPHTSQKYISKETSRERTEYEIGPDIEKWQKERRRRRKRWRRGN